VLSGGGSHADRAAAVSYACSNRHAGAHAYAYAHAAPDGHPAADAYSGANRNTKPDSTF
jgi:hypothetical protein